MQLVLDDSSLDISEHINLQTELFSVSGTTHWGMSDIALDWMAESHQYSSSSNSGAPVQVKAVAVEVSHGTSSRRIPLLKTAYKNYNLMVPRQVVGVDSCQV